MNTRSDKFSKAMVDTPPSGIRKFFEMLIGHDDVISLSVGEPDFPTPWIMREEAFYHLEKGFFLKYLGWGRRGQGEGFWNFCGVWESLF